MGYTSYYGIPIITLEAMVETAHKNVYSILEINERILNLKGEGRMTSMKIEF